MKRWRGILGQLLVFTILLHCATTSAKNNKFLWYIGQVTGMYKRLAIRSQQDSSKQDKGTDGQESEEPKKLRGKKVRHVQPVNLGGANEENIFFKLHLLKRQEAGDFKMGGY